MRIGLDVDGVLADFCTGYARLIEQVSGRNLFTQEDIRNPAVWDWDREAGYTPEEINRTWEKIKKSWFWEDLEPLDGVKDFLNELWLSEHEVYFITNRMGLLPQEQTALWLESQCYNHPSVIVSSNKGACCAALDINLYIDDKGSNIEDVIAKSPLTEAVLLNYRHNQNALVYKRVDSLEDFMELINERTTVRV